MVRGLALLVIFVTHIPANPLADFAPGAFFFHDAADAFVLMAGFAVAIAFGPAFETRGFVIGSFRILARVLKLYFAHILVVIFCAALVAWAAGRFQDPLYFESINILPLFSQTDIAVLYVLTLTFQPNFLDILPLYIILLLFFPVIALGMRASPAIVLLCSLAIWIWVQATGLNLPNIPLNGGWFFNPFAWQFLFVIGVIGGYAVRDGVTLPTAPGATKAAALVLVSIVALKSSMGGVPAWPSLDVLPEEWRIHWDKTNLSMWRTLGLLSTAYLIASLVARDAPWLDWRGPAYLQMIGRHSLPVFCVGIVGSIVGHIIFTETGRPWWVVGLVNLMGMACLLGLAQLIDWYEQAAGRRGRAKAPREQGGQQ